MEYKGTKLLIFSDLAPETLALRRALKHLTSQLQANNIPYRWGFPACLMVKKQGVSAIVRFPKDIKEFCSRLNIQYIQVENW